METLIVGGLVAGLLASLVLIAVVRSERDPVTVLVGFSICIFMIPAGYVLPGMGGAGTPGVAVGLVCAAWWLVSKALPDSVIAGSAQPVRPLLLANAGWGLVTYAAALRRPLTEIELPGADRAAITIVALTGVALIAADGIPSRRRLETLLAWVVGLAAVMGLFGIIAFATSVDPVSFMVFPGLEQNRELTGIAERSIFNRPASTALHPIEFGVVMSVVLPLALYRLSLPSTSGWQRTWRWVCLLSIAVAGPLTVSRSAILGLVVGLVVYMVALAWRSRLNLVVACAVGLVMGRVAIPGLVGTITSLFVSSSSDPSIQGRLDDVDIVLDMLSQNPVLGLGLGTYNPIDYTLLDNEYFGTTLAVGLPGLFLLMAVCAVGTVTAIRAVRRSDDATRRLGFALAGSILAATVAMATFDAFFYRIFSGVFFLLIGVAGALWRLEYIGGLPENRPFVGADGHRAEASHVRAEAEVGPS